MCFSSEGMLLGGEMRWGAEASRRATTLTSSRQCLYFLTWFVDYSPTNLRTRRECSQLGFLAGEGHSGAWPPAPHFHSTPGL